MYKGLVLAIAASALSAPAAAVTFSGTFKGVITSSSIEQGPYDDIQYSSRTGPVLGSFKIDQKWYTLGDPADPYEYVTYLDLNLSFGSYTGIYGSFDDYSLFYSSGPIFTGTTSNGKISLDINDFLSNGRYGATINFIQGANGNLGLGGTGTFLRYYRSGCCDDVEYTSFRITSGTLAVPEPSTWAMMIVGFGIAGYGVRRSRVRIATA